MSIDSAVSIIIDSYLDGRELNNRQQESVEQSKELLKILHNEKEGITSEEIIELYSLPYSNQTVVYGLRNLTEKGLAAKSTSRRMCYEISKKAKRLIEEIYNLEELEPVAEIVKQYEIAHATDDKPGLEDKITADNKLLIEYLKKLSRLEVNIYELNERYNYLNQKRTDMIIEALKENIPNDDSEVEFKSELAKPQCPAKPENKPVEPELKKPGLFNKKQVEEENRKKTEEFNILLNKYNAELSEYEKAMAAYEISMDSYNKALEEEQAAFKEKAELADSMVDKKVEDSTAAIVREVEVLKKELEDTIKAKNELYSAGVIYGKYRDVVAICTFCDYFMSGRCDSLAGPNGAYNLYEQETRDNIVISKLNDVLNSLDKIQENQYYLYQELDRVNSSLGLINGQLLVSNVIGIAQLESLENIETNTAVAG